MSLLGKHEALYRQIEPAARVVRTTASGLCADELGQAALEQQLERVVDSLQCCQRLVVHCCSNNGVALWSLLLRRRGAALAGRVAAAVYDCACECRSVGLATIEQHGPAWTVEWVFNSIWCQVLATDDR